MKKSEFQNLIKKDVNEQINEIEVWDRIKASVKADEVKVAQKNAKKHKSPKKTWVIGLSSFAAASACLILLVVFVVGTIENAGYRRKDYSSYYSKIIASDNIKFQTDIDINYLSGKISKTIKGNKEQKTAKLSVAESYAGEEMVSEIYTDGEKVYQANTSLDIKFISKMNAKQIYDYAFVLNEFDEKFLSNIVEENLGDGTRKITADVDPNNIDKLIGELPEFRQLINMNTAQSVKVTMIIDTKEKTVRSIEIIIKTKLDGADITATIKVAFEEVYQEEEIEAPEDLDDYSEVNNDTASIMNLYYRANAELFERDNYINQTVIKNSLNNQLVENTNWVVKSSGSGTSKVTHIEKRETVHSYPRNYDIWLNNGTEYKKEYSDQGAFYTKSAITEGQSRLISNYLHLGTEDYASGELTEYNGKKYLQLSRSPISVNSQFGLMSLEGSLILILDENDQVIEMTNHKVRGDRDSLIVKMTFAEYSEVVSLPEDLHNFKDKKDIAFDNYDLAYENSLTGKYSYQVRYQIDSGVESKTIYTADVFVDSDNRQGKIIYNDIENGLTYKNYGKVFEQYYDNGYIYSVVESAPFVIKEVATYSDFLTRVKVVTSVFGVSATERYSKDLIVDALLHGFGTANNGTFYFDLGLPQFAHLSECVIGFEVISDRLNGVGVTAVKAGDVPHYMMITGVQAIIGVELPNFDDFVLI